MLDGFLTVTLMVVVLLDLCAAVVYFVVKAAVKPSTRRKRLKPRSAEVGLPVFDWDGALYDRSSDAQKRKRWRFWKRGRKATTESEFERLNKVLDSFRECPI